MNTPLDKNQHQTNIDKNIDRILAIKALRNIRKFIDDMEHQDRINKKIVYIISFISISAFGFLIFFIGSHYR